MPAKLLQIPESLRDDRIRSQIRCAVCRCFRGAFRSNSKISSTNAAAPASFQGGRSVLLRGVGSALPIASRTIRRCTFSFFATPAIVPMPNSYSLRISSNSSTFVLQSNEFLRSGSTPDQEYPFVERVGQNKLPKWASSEYRNQAWTSNAFCCVWWKRRCWNGTGGRWSGGSRRLGFLN